MSAPEGPIGDVVYLTRCVIDEVVPDSDRIARMDLDRVFVVSQRHLLVAACDIALESAGIQDKRFVQARGKALRKIAAMDVERTELFRHLDAEGVWHLPLKGCVLQDLYPAYGIRQMSDNDILIDPKGAAAAKRIFEDMGFRCEHFGSGAHDVYHKEPVCNFELHRSLFAPTHDKAVYTYYQGIERLLLPDGESSFRKRLSDEDFYVYLVAHEHKHYEGGGTGLRSLLDTSIYLREKGEGMNWEYVSRELSTLGLAEFEERNRRMATSLFSGADLHLSPKDEETFSYMVDSGAYGTASHNAANQIARFGRWGYLLRRAFPSYQAMASLYPVVGRLPVLLPAGWVWRLASALVTKPTRVLFQLKAFFDEGEGAPSRSLRRS